MNHPYPNRQAYHDACRLPEPIKPIQLTYSAYASILRHGMETLPHEACGLLIGGYRSALEACDAATASSSEAAAAPMSNVPSNGPSSAAAHPASLAPSHTFTIMGSRPIPNVHPAPQHAFAFDPRAWTTALYDLHRTGQQLIGYYHSHPTTAPIPSQSDRMGIPLKDTDIMLILSFAAGIPELQAYRLGGNSEFEAVPIHILPANP